MRIQYLVRADYDPAALSRMLESLAGQNSLDQRLAGDARTLPEWASAHPDPASLFQRAANQAATPAPPALARAVTISGQGAQAQFSTAS